MGRKFKCHGVSDIYIEDATTSESGLMSAADRTAFGGTDSSFEDLVEALGSAVRLWWKCEDAIGSTTLVDSSGNAVTGTLAGTWALALPGLIGAGNAAGSKYTSGSPKQVTSTGALPNRPTTLLIVARYVDVIDYVLQPAGSATSQIGGTGIGPFFYVGTDGAINVDQIGGGSIHTTEPGVIVPGRATFIAITIGAAATQTTRTYVDGVLRAGPTNVPAWIATWTGLTVGIDVTFGFSGQIQHVVVTNTELTAAQIAAFNAAIRVTR